MRRDGSYVIDIGVYCAGEEEKSDLVHSGLIDCYFVVIVILLTVLICVIVVLFYYRLE